LEGIRNDGLYRVPFEAAEINAGVRRYLSQLMTARKNAFAVAKPRPLLLENAGK